MKTFFYLDEVIVDFDKPHLMVKDEFQSYFGKTELKPFLLSEICVLDMLYTIANLEDGYYKKRLVLKGGHSIRNLVSLIDHRFSFDADFNLNSPEGYTYGKVKNLRKDLQKYGSKRGCSTQTEVTQDSNMLYFLQINYDAPLQNKGAKMIEVPKIEICKTCRTRKNPQLAKTNTMIDLELFGLKPPELFYLSLEEQLADKLRVIGATGRQRNNFDAYDVLRICNENATKIDWSLTREIFYEIIVKSGKKVNKYIDECRHQLQTMLDNPNKKSNLENVIFNSDSFDFEYMINFVKSVYDFKKPSL
ncbi:Nucleotidyl transferase of unknown function protein [Marine Group I thaumarchaeote SCGC RSA3]|uniref:Nucleotidyl transferase AbiEii/AbiGii toxin family protein n=2 Tax=Marine Group I TaxID=905826 RepID=A0A081RQG2_9ARCH|nr:Nucleotidyl transferase of unknown function protein [Marine Group I thaumarchaeote SCGC AAA799-N04]KFM20415.1 Nucleotidyl transferase of unknown function protein [Marine Group I thaumarchaeote SCGC RSA3]